LFNEIFQANVLGVGEDVKKVMLNYSWKGNVRELRNFIEYLFNFFADGWITMANAGTMIHKKLNIGEEPNEGNPSLYSISEMEKELIKKALFYVKEKNRNVEEASTLLGIGRATLFRKIKKYHIDTS